MTYPTLNGTATGQNLLELLLYSNSVTNYLFVPFVTLAFFLVILISSIVFQLRFTNRIKPEVSLLASSFATLGWEVILMQKDGLLNPVYLVITFGIFFLSLLWVFMSSD